MREWTGHVTEEWLSDFAEGQLTESELGQMFRHLKSCDYCAEQLADFLEKDLAAPPAYLRDEILERSRCPDVQASKTIYRTSKRMQLFLYSLKVGLAVAASLFMLNLSYEMETIDVRVLQNLPENTQTSILEKIDEESRRVNDYLQNFGGRLLHIEYEEEEND